MVEILAFFHIAVQSLANFKKKLCRICLIHSFYFAIRAYELPQPRVHVHLYQEVAHDLKWGASQGHAI